MVKVSQVSPQTVQVAPSAIDSLLAGHLLVRDFERLRRIPESLALNSFGQGNAFPSGCLGARDIMLQNSPW